MKLFTRATLYSLLLSVSLILATPLSAQVKGISYTIAPAAEYTWFNNRAGLDEAFQVGGMLGIGFGEFVELRGIYMQSIDQTIDLGAFEVDETLLDNRDVEVLRYGGELKLNLSRGNFLPFLTLGAGVQDVGRTDLESAENIYASAGLGLTLSASDRFTFNLEGKNIAYSYNAVSDLLSAAEREAQNLDDGEFNLDRFGNWTVGANLEFYLGGRRPGQLSDVDEAYLNAFGNGMRGIRLPFELNLARINFDASLPYRDTWLGGGNIGVDIGPYIGLRAFYLRSMQDDAVSLDFDELALYGGDVRLNLSRTGRGFSPFLTLGGGYLDVNDDYLAREDATATSQGFATGGAGLILGLGDNLRLNGSVKSLLLSDVDVENLSSTSQITSSWMYTAGLQLAFGNRADPEAVVQQRIDSELSEQEERLKARYEAQLAENERNRQQLIQRYENRVAELEKELNATYAADSLNMDRAIQLLTEREKADSVLAELQRRELQLQRQEMLAQRRLEDSISVYFPATAAAPAPAAPTTPTASENGSVVMTAAQLNQLLDRVLAANSNPTNRPTPDSREADYERRIERLTQRLEQLEADQRYAATRPADTRPRPNDPADARETRDNAYQQRLQRLSQRVSELEESTRPMNDRAANPAGAALDSIRLQQQERIDNLEQRIEAADQPEPADAMLDSLRMQQQQRINNLEQRIEAADQPDPAVREQLEQLRQELQTMQQNRRQREEQLSEQAVQRRDQRTNDDRALRESLVELTKEIRELRADQTAYRNRLEELEADQEDNYDDLEDATDDLEDDINAATADDDATIEIERNRQVRSLESIEIQRTDDFLADTTAAASQIRYGGLSSFVGFNIGQDDNNTVNFGLRWHYDLGPSGYFQFMPETFFGLGSPTNFGIFANGLGVVKKNILGAFRPYGGAGFGFMQMADGDTEDPDDTDFRPTFNLIFGSYINVLGGRLYVDFTARNLFNNNQLVAGYRFTF